ncbi:oligosaccharide flippase family protein [Bifidobacterium adolescentis]|uniref:oligosaccharide flippase family protein n=1 Tax=Bifidobacterium adolescentis TaxID=1680 RepID=UPI003D05559C
MMVRSVKFNAIMNTLLTASTMLIGVITIPYVTRVLSVEGYGNVNFAQSLSMWLSALCLVGIPTYGVRECARVRDDRKALAQVVRELLLIISISTILVLGVFALCIFFVPRLRELAPLMWMFLIGTCLLSYGVEWYFQAMEEYEYITIRSVVFKLLSLVAIFLFVRKQNDWLIYGLIIAIMTCGNNILNIIRLFHEIPLCDDSGSLNLRRHLKPLASYAILSVASSLYLYFDSVLLGLLNANNIQVAFYQLSAKIKGICWSIINAIIGVLIPRLSYYIKNAPDKYEGLLKRGYGFVLNLCCGVMFYLFVYAQPIVILISSSKYLDAVFPIRIIGAVAFLSCMNTFLGLCISCPLGFERKLAAANMLGVPISLILNVSLDGFLGASGAAFSILIAEIVIFVKQIFDCRRILNHVISFAETFRTVLSHVAAFVVSFCFASFLLSKGNIDMFTTSGAAISIICGFFLYSAMWLCVASFIRENTAVWTLEILKKNLRRLS